MSKNSVFVGEKSYEIVKTDDGQWELSLWRHSPKIQSIKEIKGDNLHKVQILNLRQQNLQSLEGIEKFSNLEELFLSGNKISTIEDLLLLKKLKILDIYDTRLEHSPDLPKLKDLEGLRLNLPSWDGDFNSLTYIIQIPKLNHISINNSKAAKYFPKTIKGFESVPNLRYLELKRDAIIHLEGIEKLHQLETLNVSYNPLKDLSKIKLPKSLQHLIVNENRGDIKLDGGLEYLVNLRSLSFKKSNLKSIPNEINKLLNLEELNLSHNKLIAVTELKNLKNLKKLSLGYNEISDSVGLESLNKLETLDLQTNKITSVKVLETHKNLVDLNMSRNEIEDLVIEDIFPKMKKLNLYKNKLKSLKGFEKFPNLEEVDVSNNILTSFSELSGMKNLKEIKLSANHIETIPDLDKLKHLKTLFLNRNQIKGISGLNNQINLEFLDLAFNKIHQMEGVQFLTQLKELNLASNNISLINGLENLSNLEILDLSTNVINEINDISHLIHLSKLNLNENKITKITNLDALVNLEELNLYNNQIAKLEGLGTLTRLKKLSLPPELTGKTGFSKVDPQKIVIFCQDKTFLPHVIVKGQMILPEEKKFGSRVNIKLDLSNRKIKSISEIKGFETLASLDELDLSHNRIKEISGLDPLKNLRKLNISHNQLTKISGLDKLTNLGSLDLSSNKLQNIDNLKSNTHLRVLSANSNKIKQLSIPQHLVKLVFLELNSNRISKIEGLEPFINLTYLELEKNNIKEIEGISHLVMLKNLILSRNKISVIQGLDSLVALRKLELRGNQITRISGLEHNQNITSLDLSKNKISVLEGLDSLVNLGFLELFHNPIQHAKSLEKSTQLVQLYMDETIDMEIDPQWKTYGEKILKLPFHDMKIPSIFSQNKKMRLLHVRLNHSIAPTVSTEIDAISLEPDFNVDKPTWVKNCYIVYLSEADIDEPSNSALEDSFDEYEEQWWESIFSFLHDANGRLLLKGFSESNELIDWLFKNIQFQGFPGLDSLTIPAIESPYGGFYYNGEGTSLDIEMVHACKNCDGFLPIKNINDKLIAEYEDSNNDLGDCLMPPWSTTKDCPYCSKKLETITREPKWIQVQYDPSREYIDLQEIDFSVQDAFYRVPVLYMNTPRWLMIYADDPYTLLFHAIYKNLKPDDKGIKSIGPISILFIPGEKSPIAKKMKYEPKS